MGTPSGDARAFRGRVGSGATVGRQVPAGLGPGVVRSDQRLWGVVLRSAQVTLRREQDLTLQCAAPSGWNTAQRSCTVFQPSGELRRRSLRLFPQLRRDPFCSSPSWPWVGGVSGAAQSSLLGHVHGVEPARPAQLAVPEQQIRRMIRLARTDRGGNRRWRGDCAARDRWPTASAMRRGVVPGSRRMEPAHLPAYPCSSVIGPAPYGARGSHGLPGQWL